MHRVEEIPCMVAENPQRRQTAEGVQMRKSRMRRRFRHCEYRLETLAQCGDGACQNQNRVKNGGAVKQKREIMLYKGDL